MHHAPHISVIGGMPKTSFTQYWKNLRDTRKKNVYNINIALTGLDVLTNISMMTFETIKYIDRVCCNSGYLRNTQTQQTHTQMTGG